MADSGLPGNGLVHIKRKANVTFYEPVLYRYFDRAGNLLYVGITTDLKRRENEHESSPFRPFIADAHIDFHDTIKSARAAESSAIATEEPIFNLTGRNYQVRYTRMKGYLDAHATEARLFYARIRTQMLFDLARDQDRRGQPIDYSVGATAYVRLPDDPGVPARSQ